MLGVTGKEGEGSILIFPPVPPPESIYAVTPSPSDELYCRRNPLLGSGAIENLRIAGAHGGRRQLRKVMDRIQSGVAVDPP